MSDDLTGKNRFSYNALVYWIAQILVIAAGFIIPRQINDHLGQATLGVWDFGWATYNYLSITGFSALGVTRYIALNRATQDTIQQSKIYTTATILQLTVCLLLLLLTTTLATIVYSSENMDTATYQMLSIMAMFGYAVTARLVSDPSRGVVTGLHRWDIHHAINAGEDIVLAILIVSALFFNSSIFDLAKLVFFSAIVSSFVRVMIKSKICPEIEFRLKFWNKRLAVELIRFGSKSLSNSGSQLILFQTIAVVLGTVSGPAILAVYTRSQSLLRISESMIQKVANMLTPIASSLIGFKRESEARSLLLDTCTLFMCISTPISLGTFFYGDLIVELWMGADYSHRKLVGILSLGSLLPIANIGAYSVLAGMNAHGKLGIANIVITVLSLATILPIVILSFGLDFNSAAITVAIVWTLSKGVSMPVFLKLRFNIPLTQYLKLVIFRPLFYYLPAALLLYFSRIAYLRGDFLVAILIVVIAAATSLFLVWKFVLPHNMKALISPKLSST